MEKHLPVNARRVYNKMLWGGVLLFVLSIVGSIGFKLIGGPQTSWIDAIYMTFITIATIGYGEIVDLSHKPWGRVFAMFVGGAGLGTLWFLFSALTVFFLETDLNSAWARKRMERLIRKLHGHYIICGYGRVGRNVAQELEATNRHFVTIDEDLEMLLQQKERNAGLLYLHGDASDDDMLIAADIEDAKGVFAVTGDDSRNLMIVLTARQLNPKARIVARCHEVRNIDKMRKAGADTVVSPDFTGGMRIAAAMIRPQVITFLDEMLRSEHRLRLEEVTIPANFERRPLSALALTSTSFILLAVRVAGDWVFNPGHEFPLEAGQALIVMASPAGRHELESILASSAS